MKHVLTVLVLLALAATGLLQLGEEGSARDIGPSTATNATKVVDQKKTTPERSTPKGDTPVFAVLRNGARIDIGPTLARIKRGEKFPHANDGSVFGNYEKLLPRKKRGYYREYVHPTPRRRGPGARRIVMGKKREVYYTHDHYKSFVRVEVPK